MYREMDASALRKAIRVSEAELPEALLVVGEFRIARALERLAGYFDSAQKQRGTDGWLVEHDGRRYAIEVAFGAAMAGNIVHLWCGAGVPTVVQLGWFGALQPGSTAGDVLVPTHAAREEGVSDWYLAKGILADASPELAGAIAERLHALPGGVLEGRDPANRPSGPGAEQSHDGTGARASRSKVGCRRLVLSSTWHPWRAGVSRQWLRGNHLAVTGRDAPELDAVGHRPQAA